MSLSNAVVNNELEAPSVGLVTQMKEATQCREQVDLLHEMVKQALDPNREVNIDRSYLAIAGVRAMADAAFKESIHKRPHLKPEPVIYFDGKNAEPIAVKSHRVGKEVSSVYDWVSVGIDKMFENRKASSPFVVLLKETYPNAPLKDLAAALHTASERYYNEKGRITTHQLEDKSGVLVTIL